MRDYSRIDRWLHALALSGQAVRELTFDIEQSAFGRTTPDREAPPPIYVTGLARAGTSLVLRALFSCGGLTSLSYRNMPFVLAPRLWRKLSGRHWLAGEEKERAHRDGMLVSFDSPEAFEEVFWLTFCGKAYLKPDSLVPHSVDRESIKKYRVFVQSLLQSQSVPASLRYLCKNNNNILRIPALIDAFPQCRVIIMFRDPVQHAASLARQHENFKEQQSSDPFIARYMAWLAHFEFGNQHRPFNMGRCSMHLNIRPGASLKYWLSQWIDVYEHLLTLDQSNVRFVSYEGLCRSPERVFASLLRWLDIGDGSAAALAQQVRPTSLRDVREPVDPHVLARGTRTHQLLMERFAKIA